MIKRAIDIVGACAGLLVLSPLFLLIALAVRFDLRGPVFFRQERVGRGFRLFQLVKFRTMVPGADKRGPQLTAGADRRVTRVGRWLRRTKLDEIPQLFNVLRGEMSLVGPRPEVRKYVELFKKDYADLLRVRPGLTDYASLEYSREEEILGRYADPEEGYVREVLPHKIALSRQYVQESGVLADFRVIRRTIARVVAGQHPSKKRKKTLQSL